MLLPDAIETFAYGYASSRSITHPCIVARPGPLWVVRDGLRKNPAKERNREYVAFDTSPKEVVRHIKRDGPRGFVVCAVHAGMVRDTKMEKAYKGLGMRYTLSEPFFVHRLNPVPRGNAPLPVRRVKKIKVAQLIAKAARSRQIDENDVPRDDAATRLYAAFEDAQPVGWVCSIRHKNTSWVSDLFVSNAHRGMGVGSAIMRVMLRDDVKRGIKHSVLTASRAGMGVYHRLGYEQIGLLQLFRPIRGMW